MEKENSIASCFIILEDFIIKGSVAQIDAVQALNRLRDFFGTIGTCVTSKEYAIIKPSPPPGRLLKEGESPSREQGEIYDSEEKLIDSNLTQIRNIVEVELIELKAGNKAKVIHSLNVIEYYIKGLSKISKKFEEEWEKAKNKKVINEIELQFGVNTELSKSQLLIAEVCDEIKEMLLNKNRKYGNSALSPKRIFSKASPIEQINVRIDDKLSRIESTQSDDIENPVFDLLGYLVLRTVAEKINIEKKGDNL